MGHSLKQVEWAGAAPGGFPRLPETGHVQIEIF